MTSSSPGSSLCFAVVKEVELQGTFFVTANDPQRGSLAAFQVGERLLSLPLNKLVAQIR